MRIPSSYKEKEIELRKYIGQQLDRGKVECIISVESNGFDANHTTNKELAGKYYAQIVDLGAYLEVKPDDVMGLIMRMPDIFTTGETDINEGEWEFMFDLASQAIQKLKEFRSHEGETITKEFQTRIGNIQAAFDKVPEYEKARIEDIKNRIESNLDEFVGGAKVDKNRFEQELIYYIEKIDIAEEKQRLSKHLDYFLEVLNEPKSQGKKLGFISQEIGREINTLGSKSYHSEMQKLVVEMKDELEKIKEQVLNTL